MRARIPIVAGERQEGGIRGPVDRLWSEAESTEDFTVEYVAIPPRRRDWLRVLLGRYTPEVRRLRRFTLAGLNRELKEQYTSGIRAAMNDASPFLEPSRQDPEHG
jgi:hypothetical protein